MPDRLLTSSEDSLLQLEMSAVTEGSVMDVSAKIEIETTDHPLMTSTPHKKSACRATSCPEFGKSYVQKRNLVRQRSKTPQIGWWTLIPLFKKSREVAASLPGRFPSRLCSTMYITMEVEPSMAKQYKCHHCCSCKNYRGKGRKVGKVSLPRFLADQKIASS